MASTTEQGYGWDHQRERARWVKYQQAGGDDANGPHHGELLCRADECLKPNGTRWIGKDEAWDLGHHPGQRAWRGPEHVRCNRRQGAINSNRTGNPGARTAKRRRSHRPRTDLVEVSVDVSEL
jgi:hypothetical protein